MNGCLWARAAVMEGVAAAAVRNAGFKGGGTRFGRAGAEAGAGGVGGKSQIGQEMCKAELANFSKRPPKFCLEPRK